MRQRQEKKKIKKPNQNGIYVRNDNKKTVLRMGGKETWGLFGSQIPGKDT